MPRQRNHPHHHSSAERAERRATEADGPRLPSKDFIYSHDPWDPRRFAPGWARRTPWEVIGAHGPRARAMLAIGALLLIAGCVALIWLSRLP